MSTAVLTGSHQSAAQVLAPIDGVLVADHPAQRAPELAASKPLHIGTSMPTHRGGQDTLRHQLVRVDLPRGRLLGITWYIKAASPPVRRLVVTMAPVAHPDDDDVL